MRFHTMLNFKLARPMLATLTACVASMAFNNVVFADDAQDTQAMKEQMRIMRQQMDALQKQIDSMSAKQQAAPPPAAAPPQGPLVAKEKEKPEEKEPLLKKIISGFYGTLDVSFDDTTKGINGLTAYHYA